jgi:protein-L-isoaspartate O-methyltransferase
VDGDLAATAAANLAAMPWIEVRQGDASDLLAESFDAVLINAGVTHPLDWWLDGLTAAGRLVIPLTAAMSSTPIGKGLLLLVTRTPDAALFDVRPLTFVAIFSALAVRDDAINTELGRALASNPFPRIQRLRRDAHERGGLCRLHTGGFCLSIN